MARSSGKTPVSSIETSTCNSNNAITSGSTWLVGFIQIIRKDSSAILMIKHATHFIWQTFMGFVIAIGSIYAFDRYIPVITNEYSKVIKIEGFSTTMHLYGYKLRGLEIDTSRKLKAFAINEDGQHRPVSFKRLRAVGAVTYPKGWNDFGVWKFTDASLLESKPIVHVELHRPYLCITGPCVKIIGPFQVD